MKEIISLEDIKHFDSRSEQFQPLEWYKSMLESGSIRYNENSDTWNAFKYDVVKTVLSDYEHFSSEGDRTTISVKFSEDDKQMNSKVNFLKMDPPNNRKGRSLLASAFTPRSLENWKPRINQIAENLIIQIEKGKTEDIVAALANPMPAMVMSDLLGIPKPDVIKFKKWVDILFLPYDKSKKDVIDNQKNQAIKEFFTYLQPVIIEKRQQLQDDIISDLIRAEVDGERLTDFEIIEMTMAILGAGVETTSHMISTSFYALLYDDKELFSELKAHPEYIDWTVEEMLRYRFHMSRRDRTVKKDNNLLGVDLKKGDVVVAWMSAANMDEEMFEEPFQLNIHRKNNKKHLTFGNGPHFCLGAPLARLELKLILENLVKHFTKIESVESFELESNLTDSATGQTLTALPLKLY
ncbi:cytochrome P450 [Cytobacillus sp. Sa5YUA1]|uniref:Cytochrome P450 n=1 Tax=Cytobacillus stercorigallinarum TaxID=2762240 RepID=A0ABR8QSF7_9BACI|nr:cytochrome P450 [Cytobacillus stercorigallinarum]MBD7938477.1 cytochrome P450 [Cytobacillus stercorigallinarum]